MNLSIFSPTNSHKNFHHGPKDHQPPTLPTSTVLKAIIWAGSSSIGSNAIQLATATGYEVFTTASPRSFEYVKSLGASQAFDYRSPTVIQDIAFALRHKFSQALSQSGITELNPVSLSSRDARAESSLL